MRLEAIDEGTHRRISETEIPEVEKEIAEFRNEPEASDGERRVRVEQLIEKIKEVYGLKRGEITFVMGPPGKWGPDSLFKKGDDDVTLLFQSGVIEKIERNREESRQGGQCGNH